MDWIRWINDSDVGQLLSFIGMLAGIYASAKWSILFYKRHAHPIKSYALIFTILFLGLIFPVLILISTNWIGWKHILLNLVAAYGIFSFIMLLYIAKTMTSIGSRKSGRRIIAK